MTNLLLKIRFLWYACFTNRFYQDHALQPPSRNAVILDEDFSDNKFHFPWNLASWQHQSWTTWDKIIDFLPTVIQNNTLVMTTDNNNVPGQPSIKSQLITSTDFFNRKYGLFECCMKVGGQWDAFWLWFSDNQTGEMYEIDIMEMEGDSDEYYTSTVHSWGADGKTDKILGTTRVRIGDSLTKNYHVFSADWQLGYIDFYLDGVKTWHYTGKIPDCNMFVWANNSYKGGQLPVSNFTKAIRVQT